MNYIKSITLRLLILLGSGFILLKPELVLAEQQVIYLTRHAEKQAQPKDDPALTVKGEARALYIAQLLSNKNIQQIFSTHYKRTRSTAKPLANRQGIAIEIYSPSHPDDMIKQVLNSKKNTLIVGHSNTLNDLVIRFGGKVKTTIEHDDYDNLYRLIITPEGVKSQLLKTETEVRKD